MKHSIALKIFSLAVLILIMMIVVAFINSVEVIKLGGEVEDISKIDMPIASHSADLNETGLRRRIAFERLYREYGATVPDTTVVNEAEVNFKKFTLEVKDKIKLLRSDLDSIPENRGDQELFIQARELVAEIETTFEQQSEIATTILKARKAKDGKENKELMNINVKLQSNLQDNRSKLQGLTQHIAEDAVTRTKKSEMRVLWSSLTITLLALFLGLWGAWVLSKRLARPILQLLQSTKDVQGGNLSVNIVNLPEDEIGQLGDSLNKMIEELRRKEALQNMISTYIDPRIVEKIIIPGRAEILAGQRQTMTVMFTDLQGFTKIGEQLSPTGLVKLTNRYFTIMTECIQAEHGIIDKFIGDAIMAYWGPPFISEDEQAAAACRAALRQKEAQIKFRSELPELLGLRKDLPEINIRIGIATGEVVVGNIGSDTTRSYTVMGDVVNLASRLETANSQYGTVILISDVTMRMAETQMESREIDKIVFKGKSEPVKVFELLSSEGSLSSEMNEQRKRFSEGLEAYRKQDWRAAEAIFKELVDKFDDKPAHTFINRISMMEKHNIGQGWDGVWRMTSK
ncbi:MAG: adenylate/guanylate cyclase domain-containing protein [Bacteroidota bacterium]